MDAAAYRALITARLAERTDAFAAVLADVAQLRAGPHATLYIEVEVAAMTDVFPVSIFLDGPRGTPHVPAEICTELGQLGALLSNEEEDGFVVFEDGPHGPQHALEQPILDGVAAEQNIILPWIVNIAKNAGLDAVGCEVVASLHDSADPQVIVPRSDPPSDKPIKSTGFWSSFFKRNAEPNP